MGAFETEFCGKDPVCAAIERCVLDSGCFEPLAPNCYCGGELEACLDPKFVPKGPCATEIRAGAGSDAPENRVILERYFHYDYPVGIAMNLVDEAKRVCHDECFPKKM